LRMGKFQKFKILHYMSDMNKIRFAVVGQGHIGKRHAEMILRNPNAELVAVCDIRSKDECKVGYDVPFYSSLDEMLRWPLKV
jgi:UDP-N-acetyl-2-amino-2-deoxyglucuronate dehydrogenase